LSALMRIMKRIRLSFVVVYGRAVRWRTTIGPTPWTGLYLHVEREEARSTGLHRDALPPLA
jgi:hypothetical protein